MSEGMERMVAGLREAAAIAEGKAPAPRVHMNGHAYVPEADKNAAWLAGYAAAREQAAKVAEGPPYETNSTTGEVSIRGTSFGNWSVPQPKAGFRGSDYGTGRQHAADAIRSMEPEETKT